MLQFLLLKLPLKHIQNHPQPFQRNNVTWQDHLGSSAHRWCGSENAAHIRGDVVGYTTLAGSEIRVLEPMNFL